MCNKWIEVNKNANSRINLIFVTAWLVCWSCFTFNIWLRLEYNVTLRAIHRRRPQSGGKSGSLVRIFRRQCCSLATDVRTFCCKILRFWKITVCHTDKCVCVCVRGWGSANILWTLEEGGQHWRRRNISPYECQTKSFEKINTLLPAMCFCSFKLSYKKYSTFLSPPPLSQSPDFH